MSKETRVVPPDTSRIVEGLRDTGYTVPSAIADIVDNSIAADASHISVWIGYSALEDLVVTVSDNGIGMTERGLENAMRYGSDRRKDPNSLGRFGLGLKTASTSFCRRLTVISKMSAEPTSAATWDLNELEAAGDWNLSIGPLDEQEADVFQSGIDEIEGLGGEFAGGTVVWWDEIDRLLKTKAGSEAKNRTLAMARTQTQVQMHLRTVFQRFLDASDTRERTVVIGFNGVPLEPWDPFGERIGGEKVLQKTFRFASPAGEQAALLRAFILPRKEEFASESDREAARISVERQGIYLYREGRMIEGPSWLGTGITETHINNMRVELSFPAQLDDVFGVGIRKSGVQLDPSLIEELRAVLTPVRREANRRSRQGNAGAAAKNGTARRPTETTIGRVKTELTVASVETAADGTVTLRNNTGEVALVDSAGRPSGLVRISVDGTEAMNVARAESLQDGVLWEASLGAENLIQVNLNTGHDWYRKAYTPNSTNSPLAQAIEYLFYALAQAEINNTNLDLDEVFEEFRIEVSRNLRRLVRDLPEPDDEA